MAWRRSGAKPLSEPMKVRIPTHICVIHPQSVVDRFYTIVKSFQILSLKQPCQFRFCVISVWLFSKKLHCCWLAPHDHILEILSAWISVGLTHRNIPCFCPCACSNFPSVIRRSDGRYGNEEPGKWTRCLHKGSGWSPVFFYPFDINWMT